MANYLKSYFALKTPWGYYNSAVARKHFLPLPQIIEKVNFSYFRQNPMNYDKYSKGANNKIYCFEMLWYLKDVSNIKLPIWNWPKMYSLTMLKGSNVNMRDLCLVKFFGLSLECVHLVWIWCFWHTATSHLVYFCPSLCRIRFSAPVPIKKAKCEWILLTLLSTSQ